MQHDVAYQRVQFWSTVGRDMIEQHMDDEPDDIEGDLFIFIDRSKLGGGTVRDMRSFFSDNGLRLHGERVRVYNKFEVKSFATNYTGLYVAFANDDATAQIALMFAMRFS